MKRYFKGMCVSLLPSSATETTYSYSFVLTQMIHSVVHDIH